MSGQSKISLTDFEDCNSNPKDDCAITEKCCCFHQLNLNFDFDTNIELNTISIQPALICTVESTPNQTESTGVITFYHSDLSPPGGLEFLKQIQVFRL